MINKTYLTLAVAYFLSVNTAQAEAIKTTTVTVTGYINSSPDCTARFDNYIGEVLTLVMPDVNLPGETQAGDEIGSPAVGQFHLVCQNITGAVPAIYFSGTGAGANKDLFQLTNTSDPNAATNVAMKVTFNDIQLTPNKRVTAEVTQQPTHPQIYDGIFDMEFQYTATGSATGGTAKFVSDFTLVFQ